MIERAAGFVSETVLVPPEKLLPPLVPHRQTERVLHFALKTPQDPQAALERALRSIAVEYAEVDWCRDEYNAGGHLRNAAAALRPTLIFMQIQKALPRFASRELRAVREVCDPSCVIVNWDGDQHYEPEQHERAWFVELGRVADTSLVVNTDHPHRYGRMGVRFPGYLQIGYDERIYRPDTTSAYQPKRAVVFLGQNYPHIAAYDRRRAAVRALRARFGDAFAAHGNGWTEADGGAPFLPPADEAAAYWAAHAAISISIRADLPRYTSDRLFRLLGSGGVPVVERFADMEGLGLEEGVNCVGWSSPDELCAIQLPADWDPRPAAFALAYAHHTWQVRMQELLAIVDHVRARR